MKIWFAIGLALLVGPFSTAAQAKKKVPVLFTVGKQEVSADEFIRVFHKNNPNQAEKLTEEKIDEYLTLYVHFKLKVKAALAAGLDTTQAFQKEYATYRDELRKPFLASADDLERLARETYQRLEEEVNASHILLTLSPDAPPADTLRVYERMLAIRQRLVAGENFEAVAREVSEDPSAAHNGGNLGYFTALQMVFPFEDAAYRLEPGQLSLPVRTRFGYHLIKVHARQKARGEVEVAHILLRGTDPTVRGKALVAAEQLKKGREWAEVCREYSEDAATRENGGRLRPFGVGAVASVPQFEAAAFQLQHPGEISDPFASAVGWHIVKLEKKIPLPPYADMQPALQRRVARDDRFVIAKAKNRERRKRDLQYTEIHPWLDSLRKLADTTLTNANWVWKQPAWANQPLATLAGTKIEAATVAHYLQRHQKPSALPPRDYFQQLYDQFADERLSEEEEKQLLRSNEAYRNLVSEYREGMLMFSIMEQEVWNKASADTAGQRSHYLRHRESYRAGERLWARLLAAPSLALRDALKARIEKGDTLNAEDIRNLKHAGSFRAYQKGEQAAIDRVPWAVGLHPADMDGTYYLVDVERLLPPGVQAFTEARARVVADYQDELEKQWLASLKVRYPVRVNKKVKRKVMATLLPRTA